MASPPPRSTSTAPATPAPVYAASSTGSNAVSGPAQQHVDRLEPVQRAQPHLAVPHRHVGPLGEVVAELGGEVRVLDVPGVVGGAGHDHRRGLGARPARPRPAWPAAPRRAR